MCEKCEELDSKIEHYERIRASMLDKLTVDRIKELVAEMKKQKPGSRDRRVCRCAGFRGNGLR